MLWRIKSIIPVAILTVLCVCCMLRGGETAVISIDFSNEWLKVALVKPGVPMEIVLNKESKRKTAAIVALRDSERSFGEPASSVAVKYPKKAYQFLQFLIGLHYDNPLVKKYREWFPYYDIRNDDQRDTLIFQHDDDLTFTPDELIGMLLNHSRELAQDYAGTPIRDTVIVLPVFYNQAQRRAVLHAAKLVGLNVLQLMTDSAAVALNYGVFRRDTFNSTPTYIMFYDMGAASTTVSIVEYKKAQVKEGNTKHIYPQLTVKGVGFDRTLGGLEMDIRLRDHLAKIFTTKHKTSGNIYDSPRAMAKLLKEAKILKTVLSANTHHNVQIEGVFEDIDFSTKVSRTELEDLCSDLFDRIDGTIKQALKVADITMDEIDSVILVGGGTRVPRVQEELRKSIKKSDLGKSLNTDEAAALGAVYQAASMSKLFRVKKFIVKDANVFPIQVSFDKPIVDSDGKSATKTVIRTLFDAGNPYPQKKVLTFNRYNSDFDFSVFYGNLNYLSQEEQSYVGPRNISKIHLDGVMEALDDKKDGASAGVKAHFKMDESGILTLDSVQSLFEYEEKEDESTFSKFTNAFSNLFSGSETEPNKDGEVKQEAEMSENDDQQNQSEESDNETKEENEESNKETDTVPEDENISKQETKEEEVEKKEENKEELEVEEEEKVEEKEEEEAEEEEEEEEEDTEEEVEVEEEEKVEDKEEEEAEKEQEVDEKEEEEEEEEAEKEQEVDEKEEEEEEEEEMEDRQKEGNEEDDREKVKDGESSNEESETESEETKTTQSAEEGNTTDTLPSNKTNKTVSAKKPKKEEPKTKTVKINITATVDQLDMAVPSEKEADISTTKLHWLQQKDEDKKENEKAKNSLESHIFEVTDFMYSEEGIVVSTDTERDTILEALRVAGEWMEDEGYDAETEVYYQKLRELRRSSRAIFRRLNEAIKRPKFLANLKSSINMSFDFLNRMKNFTEMEILTEVEMATLQNLTMETMIWLFNMETEQNATKPFEDPIVLCSELEEKTRKLDREIMYLLNKIKLYKPKPKPKDNNSTNTTTTNKTSADKEYNSSTESTEKSEIPTSDDDEETETKTSDQINETDEESTTPEVLTLPHGDQENTEPTDIPTESEDEHSEL